MVDRRKIAINAAKEVERILLENYKKVDKVMEKARNNYVTNVDLMCEKSIINAVHAETDDSVLSEEAGDVNPGKGHKWIIDPLDGTHNYIQGFPLFGTSIALEKEGEVILGVISLPLFGYLFVAEKGEGCTLNGEPISVSEISELSKSLLVIDSALAKQTEKKFRFIRKVSEKVFRVRMSGCSVFDMTTVAHGDAEEHVLFQTNPWDIAAGMLMVREAGGKVTDFSGRDCDHYSPVMLATNGKVHQEMVKLLSNS